MARPGRSVRRTVLCDTNVLIRFLTADHPQQSPQARRAVEAAAAGRVTIVITDVVVAELVFVLTSVYGLTERDIADRLTELLSLPGVESSDAAMLADALTVWAEGGLDFVDAYLVAIDRATRDVDVLSFDRDFDRIEGVDRVDPATY
jgi:predicted nucleic acid-binding protein